MKKLKNIFKRKKEDDTFYPPFFEGGRTPEEMEEIYKEDQQTRKEIEELKRQGKYVDIFERIEKAKKTKEYRDYAGE